MAGHSQWANIRFRKEAQDKKKGKVFTKLIREITLAARTGGADLANNPRLRACVDKALDYNMSKDTVERAIKRGAGLEEGQTLEEILYEGYAPGGVAVMVRTLTDNRNRTASEVRHAFTKYEGNLGASGCVAYLFHKWGVLFYPDCAEEDLFEHALEAGAEELLTFPEGVEVRCPPELLFQISDYLEKKGFSRAVAEMRDIPERYVEVNSEHYESVQALLQVMEELDDVQAVFSNLAETAT